MSGIAQAGIMGSFERYVRVDELFVGNNFFDVDAWMALSANAVHRFVPTGFILGAHNSDAAATVANIDMQAWGNSDRYHRPIPLALNVIHAGRIRGIWPELTTASQIFLVGVTIS